MCVYMRIYIYLDIFLQNTLQQLEIIKILNLLTCLLLRIYWQTADKSTVTTATNATLPAEIGYERSM